MTPTGGSVKTYEGDFGEGAEEQGCAGSGGI